MSAIITYRNLADDATITATTESGYPVENLQVRQLSTKCRVSTPTFSPVTIEVELTEQKDIKLVGLLSCVGMSRLISVSTSVDNVTWTPDIDYSSAFDQGVPGLPFNAFAVLDASQTFAKYLRIKVAQAEPSDSYAAIGRLWVGDAIVVPFGANSDWSIATRERGTVDESSGLEVYPSAKPRGRELRMSFSPLDVALAFGPDGGGYYLDRPSFQDLHTHAGAIGEVIALPRSTDLWPRRLGVYGRLTDDSLTIRHLAGPNYATETRVIEER